MKKVLLKIDILLKDSKYNIESLRKELIDSFFAEDKPSRGDFLYTEDFEKAVNEWYKIMNKRIRIKLSQEL